MFFLDFLRLTARRVPGKTAIIIEDRSMRYDELDSAANQFANALLDLGLPKGTTVAIQAINRFEYAIAYFGIARAGYVSAHISTKATVNDLTFMLSKTDARVLIADKDRYAVARQALSDIIDPGRIILLGVRDQRAIARPGPMTFEQFVADHPQTYPQTATELEHTDPISITFTGGTTGFPKGVIVSHRARTATAHTALAYFGLNETDILCTTTPLFHAAGLFVVFAPAIVLGASVVLMKTWDVGSFIENVERHKVTATFLVPS